MTGQDWTIYFGPPGTGKTRTLIERVKEHLSAGVPASRVAFLSFSRRAAHEARDRAASELGLDGDETRYWSTLHSAAARQLGVGPSDLLKGGHWRELGRLLDMTFVDVDEAGRPVGATWSKERGKAAQSVYAYRRATQAPMDLRSLWRDYGARMAQVTDLLARTLSEYKHQRGLIDYADLLDEAPGALPVNVAVIDEAQDLTPAQWDYALRAVSEADQVYVAGDDDQAIYEWAGADVRRFLSLRGDRHVLHDSYRLPSSVYEVAERVSGRIRTRQEKDWRPIRHGGEVERVNTVDQVHLDGEWLLLARTRHALGQWEAVARDQGIRYVKQGVDSVRPEEARAIRAWETFRRGRHVSGAALREALALTDVDARVREEERYAPGDLHLENVPHWRDAMTKIPPARRRYYEACLRRSSRALSEEPQVRISTIHAAKGAEADNVGLMTDSTRQIEAGMRRDPDAEHRVWYVAVTRARGALTLVTPTVSERYRV